MKTSKSKSKKRMDKLITEERLYAQLARRGDPSAFFALFCSHIRNLYTLQRARGMDHKTACDIAARQVALMYRKYIKYAPAGNPQSWFAAGCGLKRLNAKTTASMSAVPVLLDYDMADYEKEINRTLNIAYTSRLEKGSDGKGNFRSERPFLPYITGSLAAAVLIALLFYSKAVFTVSFGQFGKEYGVSFPNVAERLWNLSGLVRAGGNVGAGSGITETPDPAHTSADTGSANDHE